MVVKAQSSESHVIAEEGKVVPKKPSFQAIWTEFTMRLSSGVGYGANRKPNAKMFPNFEAAVSYLEAHQMGWNAFKAAWDTFHPNIPMMAQDRIKYGLESGEAEHYNREKGSTKAEIKEAKASYKKSI